MPETDRAKKLIKRYERLQSDKSPWLEHWEDLAQVMLPRRIGFSTTPIEGARRTEDIFDGTPLMAARSFANAVGTMVRPKGGLPDVTIEAEDDRVNNSDEAKEWFADSLNRLERAYSNPAARYIESCGETEADMIVFGTATQFEAVSRFRNGFIFQTSHLKDVVPIFDEEGNPEGLFRKRRMRIEQAADRFGESNLSTQTREKLKRNQDDKIDLLHAVLPRKNGRPGALFARNMPIGEVWIEFDTKEEINESGYHEFPFIVPRWDTSSGEDYGRSPGMIALPDADTAQAMGETVLIAGQRQADPPLAVPNDGTFDAINTFPGGLAYYDVETASSVGGNPFFPITSGANLSITRDMQLDTRQQIWAAFYRNVLNLPVEGPQMTATEVIQRKQEMLREIGPVFGRRETDYIAPQVERGFMIMLRAGAFLPVPRILQGQRLRFVVASVVKKIAMQIDAAAAEMWAGKVFELEGVSPGASDNVNVDELVRFSAKANGVPQEIVNSQETVQNIRKARAESQQAQVQAVAAAEQIASAQGEMEMRKTGAEAEEKAASARLKDAQAENVGSPNA